MIDRAAVAVPKRIMAIFSVASLVVEAAGPVHPSKSGSYRKGSWSYVYSIRAQGSRSEWRHGELRFEGGAVQELMEVRKYDTVRTPWGLMQYFGPKHRYNSGWLLEMTYGHPLDKRGRLLRSPKPGDALKAKRRPIELTPKHADEAVRAFVGQTIRLRLNANPSTGFAWVVKKLKGDSVSQKGKIEFKPAPGTGGVVGAGGTAIAIFRAVKPGASTYILEYKRPWEKKDPARTHVIHFGIQANEVDQPKTTGS